MKKKQLKLKSVYLKGEYWIYFQNFRLNTNKKEHLAILMNRHQVLTGAANSFDNSVSIGSVENNHFTVLF